MLVQLSLRISRRRMCMQLTFFVWARWYGVWRTLQVTRKGPVPLFWAPSKLENENIARNSFYGRRNIYGRFFLSVSTLPRALIAPPLVDNLSVSLQRKVWLSPSPYSTMQHVYCVLANRESRNHRGEAPPRETCYGAYDQPTALTIGKATALRSQP